MIKKMTRHPLTSMYIAQGQRNGQIFDFIKDIKTGNHLTLILSQYSWYSEAGVPLSDEPRRLRAVSNMRWYKNFMKQQYSGE